MGWQVMCGSRHGNGVGEEQRRQSGKGASTGHSLCFMCHCVLSRVLCLVFHVCFMCLWGNRSWKWFVGLAPLSVFCVFVMCIIIFMFFICVSSAVLKFFMVFHRCSICLFIHLIIWVFSKLSNIFHFPNIYVLIYFCRCLLKMKNGGAARLSLALMDFWDSSINWIPFLPKISSNSIPFWFWNFAWQGQKDLLNSSRFS